jgi:hypothetical protein
MYYRYNVQTGIHRIKSKYSKLSKKITISTATTLTALAFAVVPALAATLTVTPSNPQGWYIQPSTGGTVQYVAATGGLGSGAVQFSTSNDSDFTRFKNNINVSLSSITSLSYMTHQVSAPVAAETYAAVNLRLYVDNNGDNTVDDVLVYEPYYNAPVTSTGWQTWNITQSSGYWWSNSQLTYNGNPTTGAGDANNITLSDVLASFTTSKVLSIGLGTGDSNSPWVVQADALKVNDTTYDFEIGKAQDQCKDNGWKTIDSNNKSFKNQGDCVSSFATNGKNQASGQ